MEKTFSKKESYYKWSFFMFIAVYSSFASSAMSSYPIGPNLINGEYHMIWMWRNNELANTNHSLSYAKSNNLITWTTCQGKNYKAPLRYEKEFIVERGRKYVNNTVKYTGLLNSRQNFSVIDEKVIISYVINNESGTQLVNAVLDENCNWDKFYITNNCEFLDLNKYGTLPDSEKIKFTHVSKNKSGYSQRIFSSLKSCDGKDQSGTWLMTKTFEKIKQTTIQSKTNPYNKTIKTKNFYIQWNTKPNNGDNVPSCILSITCSTGDFFTNISLTDKRNNEHQLLKTQENAIEFSWGGSKANYAAFESDEFLYLSYFNNMKKLVISQIKNGKIINTLQLADANDIWDSHNNIISVLHNNKIYISGNIHNNSLKIYVLKKDPLLLENIIENEDFDKITYPNFFKSEKNLKIIFRNGKSGDGEYFIANVEYENLVDIYKLFENQ